MNYKVYQGTELKQTVTSKTAVMNGLQPNRTYEFGVQPNDGNRDGPKATTSVTTRGIRFNIPKTMTVGSTITLRYEEYALGLVPIGNEPSGMFGGGNKKNLSAKVISTANGSSVVEVAGNVIDVGERNYYQQSTPAQVITLPNATYKPSFERQNADRPNGFMLTGAQDNTGIVRFNNVITGNGWWTVSFWMRNNQGSRQYLTLDACDLSPVKLFTSEDDTWQKYIYTVNITNYSSDYNFIDFSSITWAWFLIKDFKVEQGDTATPYASFVDGDTFTAQPDGTFSLFSEYKALYY